MYDDKSNFGLSVTKKKEIKNKIHKKIIKTDKIKTKKKQKDQKEDEDETSSISTTSDEFHVNSEYDDEICSFDSQVDFSGNKNNFFIFLFFPKYIKFQAFK